MGYRSLRACVEDLERTKQLHRIEVPIDPHLEAAEIQRRVFRAGGPALLFTRVTGCSFPMVSNMFGTRERVRFLFRDALEGVRALVDARVSPGRLLARPWRTLGMPAAASHLLPWPMRRATAPVLAHDTTLSALPRLVSWPDDGGPFITLPLVYTEDPDAPGVRHSNLGMYRVQLAGNDYVPDREVGLHYQIHRGIGVHHSAAIRRNEPLAVNVFVGGPPALTVAAVMPLPEGMPELAFAGALNGRAIRVVRDGQGPAIVADADFCIRGEVMPAEMKPEGPFGDHLGYYSKTHPFPVLRVRSVHHRERAIWPFTVVGRPPQEDTMFGELIHELTGPLVSTVLPGVRAVHAVDAAGVHPLLLAVGSERYVPYAKPRRPMELLTQASAILGQGQMSLAKYLFIAAEQDAPALDVHDVGKFLHHVLERLDPSRDLHFFTNTTIDTLDYSGTGFNEGSKVVIAVTGDARRKLSTRVPTLPWPPGFEAPRLCMPGVLAISGPTAAATSRGGGERLGEALASADPEALSGFPLIVLVDDSAFAATSLDNFLWVTFTRSNPAVDIHGVREFVEDKAWGCRGPVIIDARRKAHHAPPLVEDPGVSRRVDALAARSGPLHGLF
jgi:4-hydroxy-3-polyprenylbenzoate decarboxylase